MIFGAPRAQRARLGFVVWTRGPPLDFSPSRYISMCTRAGLAHRRETEPVSRPEGGHWPPSFRVRPRAGAAAGLVSDRPPCPVLDPSVSMLVDWTALVDPGALVPGESEG